MKRPEMGGTGRKERFVIGEVGVDGRAALLLLPAGRPGPHDLTEDRELADVVGVVVADQAHLAEDRVPRRVRDRTKQVRGGIGNELMER